jgi:hypothetical protein
MHTHTLHSIGQCRPEGTKIKWLEITLESHPQFTSSIFLWKTAKPDIKTRKLFSLIAYLFEQYGKLKARTRYSRDFVSQVGSTTGTAFSTPKSFYDDPTPERSHARPVPRNPRQQVLVLAPQLLPLPSRFCLKLKSRPPHHKYCYIHGHNLSHWDTACRDMTIAPEVYQTAIGAKKPSHTDPPGETHVQALKGAAKPIQISESCRSWPERPERN